MLEFIGLTVIVYLIFMGVARLFRGKQPKREVYIIHHYELEEEPEVPETGKDITPDVEEPLMEKLPDNVVPIHRKKQ